MVAILRHGPGHTLLIRTELDALPVEEKTGLLYSSLEPGVMHACGHDIHTTMLIGTARAMATSRDKWHGTLMLVGQPSEETIDGAKAMLADNLYQRFGKPDRIIGLHNGRLMADGEPAAIIASPIVQEAYLGLAKAPQS